MRIAITTIREIPDDLYWEWADVLLESFEKIGNTSFTRAHFEQLYEEGRFEVTDIHERVGTVTSVYQIVERGLEH